LFERLKIILKENTNIESDEAIVAACGIGL